MVTVTRAIMGLISICVCGVAPRAGAQKMGPPAGDTAASHVAAAERVLVAMGAEKMSRDVSDAMYQNMTKSNPSSNPGALAAVAAMRDVMQKYTSYEAMKPDMIKAYTATYTEAELKEIAALYQTDAGRMMVARTPKVLALTQASSAVRMQAMQAEIKHALESAIEGQSTPEQQARMSAPGYTFFEYQVETPAALAPDSPALKYPAALQGSNAVVGEVFAMFVVDTLGVAELRSLRIMRSTDPAFAEALRQQLSGLRFTPAKKGGRNVKQLVQMSFKFTPAR